MSNNKKFRIYDYQMTHTADEISKNKNIESFPPIHSFQKIDASPFFQKVDNKIKILKNKNNNREEEHNE